MLHSGYNTHTHSTTITYIPHVGVLDLSQVGEIAEALVDASSKCVYLVREFGFNPKNLVTATDSDFNLMLDNIVESGRITQETLACALEKKLVGYDVVAKKIRRSNFSDASR